MNTPILELLAEYEAEDCDFSDLEWVARTALRHVDSMEDSQNRCLLYALASYMTTHPMKGKKMTNYSMITDKIKFSCSTTIETVGKGFIVTFQVDDEEGHFQQSEVFSSEIELLACVIRSFISREDIETALPLITEAIKAGQAEDDSSSNKDENVH